MRRIPAPAIVLFAASLSSCAIGPVTLDSLPRAETFRAESLSQYGVTWTFGSAMETGRFANGDYWVVGPVDIVGIDPVSATLPQGTGTRTVNGSMLDPEVNWSQGYDSWMLGSEGRSWDASLNAAMPNGAPVSPSNPLRIETGSLISSISYPELRDSKNVRVMAVLTVLPEVPPRDAFRPPYAGKDKTIKHALAQARLERLPSRPFLASFGDREALADESLSSVEKPWIEHMRDWQKEIFCAPDNMPSYGREYAGVISQAACLLSLDIDRLKKETLAARIIQIGLDNYGLLRCPDGRETWKADGGHMSGRSFPLVFAGYMLDDAEILGVMAKAGDYAYEGGYREGALPPDYVHFGELDQTFYVTKRDVVRTSGGVTPGTWEPDPRSAPQPYAIDDLGRAEWGINHAHSPSGDNANPDAIYRYVCAITWPGMALAARMMGIEERFNHPAFFDYVDAWMDRPDGGAGGSFVPAVWNAYRGQY